MKYINYLLVLLVVGVFLAVLKTPTDNLSIIACDVGQGDAILIQKGNTQILIDGGPNNSVLACLGKYIPFYDKEIELVILTHPEKDHFGGLIDVFKAYKVDKFGVNGHKSDSQDYGVLINEVGGSGTDTIVLVNGMVLRLGMIYLDILNPQESKEFSDTNDNGVVTLLRYENYKAILMADVENQVSDLISENPKIQNVNYIKVNHHGSKNGMSEKLIEATTPDLAVISVGAKNSYGHPTKEILDLLEKYNTKVLRTDQIGDVEIKIDEILK